MRYCLSCFQIKEYYVDTCWATVGSIIKRESKASRTTYGQLKNSLGLHRFWSSLFIGTSVSLSLLFYGFWYCNGFLCCVCGRILYPIFLHTHTLTHIYIYVWLTILLNSIRQVHKFQKRWLPQPTHFEYLTNHLSSRPIEGRKKNKREKNKIK